MLIYFPPQITVMVVVYGEICKLSPRVERYLNDPDRLVKYILIRASSSGFSVTPARVEQIMKAVKELSSQDLSYLDTDARIRLLGEIFAAYMAQDPDSAEDFRKFWKNLWYVCNTPSGSGGTGGGKDVLGGMIDNIVDRITKRVSRGIYRVPPEVIQE